MSNGKENIESYSAQDIIRYHEGKMNPAEMHALEKAALEDPFLADAIEGYSLGINEASGNIEEIAKRLDERINPKKGKVIAGGFNYWLKLAAVLVVLGISSVALYQMFKSDERSEIPSIAKVENKTETQEPEATVPIQSDSLQKGPQIVQAPKKDIARVNEKEAKKINQGEPTGPPELKQADEKVAANGIINDSSSENQIEKANVARGETVSAANAAPLSVAKSKAANSAVSENIQISDDRKIKRNLFNGVIVDQKNNPLPFANVVIQNYGIGTYADVHGNFSLVAPDSLLNVEVKSLGYTLKLDTLVGNTSNNKIVMEALPESAERAFLQRKDVAALKSLNDNRRTMKSEVTEPEDGWANYDIYLDNNSKLSDILNDESINGEVLVSFEVNEAGRPVNLKIEKSLCDECDSEALRLIREGPQWKSRIKNARGKVSVKF